MAMLTDTNVPAISAPARTARLLDALGALCSTLSAGVAAARDFDRLQHASDEELARQGLTRSQVIDAVRARHFG